MRKDVKIALDDCKSFLKLAEKAKEIEMANRVIASLNIRAVIRGNDALCLYYLGEKPSRHGQAPKYFQSLYEKDHISDKYSRYRSNIGELVNKKADMEYKPVNPSKNDLKKIEKKSERFIENAVHNLIET